MNENKPKFTPGPWKPGLNKAFSTVLDGHEGKAIYPAKGNNHIAWANIAKGNGHIDMERAVANARLIAAAPEMYELLQRLSHALFAEDADEWTAEIESLLAKANGVDDE